MEIISYGGWNRCARLVSGDVELVVTLEIGPRVIRCGLTGGPNEFVEHPEDMGHKGGGPYRSYGGHRLWVAPEVEAITLQPDNDPVEHTSDGATSVFTTRTDRWHVQKEIRITPLGGGAFELEHRLYNRGGHPLELTTWALTQLAPNGEAYFPMPSFKPHTEEVLPDRPLALWGYTDLSDPRWTWSQSLGQLRQDPARGPQKIGMFCPQGWAAYANHGNLWIKVFDAVLGGDYADYGCNFETFTNQKMLELESLGEVTIVDADDHTGHIERWGLLNGARIESSSEAALKQLSAIADKLKAKT
jgi:hypothetical protein